jgi:hypothetical protein
VDGHLLPKKYTTAYLKCVTTENTTIHNASDGIFIGLTPDQKGLLVFLPHLLRIMVSNYCRFDASFSNAMCRTCRTFLDALPVRPPPPIPNSAKPSLPTIIPLFTLKRGLMILINIEKKSSSQDPKISESNSQNIQLPKVMNH